MRNQYFKTFKIIIFVSIICWANILFAQIQKIQPNRQYWFQLNQNTKITNNLTNVTDLGLRTENHINNPRIMFIRDELEYKFKKKYSAAAGYALFSYKEIRGEKNKFSSFENRPYLKFEILNENKKFITSHRFIIEERIPQNAPIYLNLRYRIKRETYFLKKSKYIAPDKFTYTLGYEFMGRRWQSGVLEFNNLNRFLLGINYYANKRYKISMLYMNEISTNNFSQIFKSCYLKNNIFWLILSHR